MTNKPTGKALSPTWRGVLPLLLDAYANGTDEGRATALAELERLCDIADAYNASQSPQPTNAELPSYWQYRPFPNDRAYTYWQRADGLRIEPMISGNYHAVDRNGKPLHGTTAANVSVAILATDRRYPLPTSEPTSVDNTTATT